MNILLHQIIKDLRSARVWLAICLGVFVVAVLVGKWLDAAEPFIFILYFGLFWACVAIVVRWILADNPSSPNAFWKTRPPSWRVIAASKVLILLLLSVLAFLVAFVLDFPGEISAQSLFGIALKLNFFFLWTVSVLGLAVIAGSVKRFVILGICLLCLMTVWEITSNSNYSKPFVFVTLHESRELTFNVFLGLWVIASVFFQYRRFRFGVGLVQIGLAWSGYLLIQHLWPVDYFSEKLNQAELRAHGLEKVAVSVTDIRLEKVGKDSHVVEQSRLLYGSLIPEHLPEGFELAPTLLEHRVKQVGHLPVENVNEFGTHEFQESDLAYLKALWPAFEINTYYTSLRADYHKNMMFSSIKTELLEQKEKTVLEGNYTAAVQTRRLLGKVPLLPFYELKDGPLHLQFFDPLLNNFKLEVGVTVRESMGYGMDGYNPQEKELLTLVLVSPRKKMAFVEAPWHYRSRYAQTLRKGGVQYSVSTAEFKIVGVSADELNPEEGDEDWFTDAYIAVVYRESLGLVELPFSVELEPNG